MDATITPPHTHSIAWARATASLWGHASDHDLDEPVALTDEVPVRIRVVRDEHAVVTDRRLSLKTKRAGTHTMLRFAFGKGTNNFFEVEVGNLGGVQHNETVEITV